jgi:hypothetical protein
LLVYQGDSFPAEYRGKLFMNNIHGARINMDIPERKGSGFVAHHGADFIKFNDKWSQIVNLQTGPDGSVFMIDWYDKNQCHLNTPESHDRSNGRIFRISYGQKNYIRKPDPIDLQKLSDEELVKLLASKNSWQARHAQRLLQERAGQRELSSDAQTAIRRRLSYKIEATFIRGMEPTLSDDLRALWLSHVVGKLKTMEPLVEHVLLKDEREHLRAWTIQLACEDKNPSDALLKEFARMAREDKSPVVRLYLASALQRLPIEKRGEILESLLAHEEDAKDQNLPLMYWYAAEPLAGKDVATAAKLLAKTKIPQVREFITRRMTAK